MEMKEMENLFKRHIYGAVGQPYTIIEGEKEKIPHQIIEVIDQIPQVFEEPKGCLLLGHMTITFYTKRRSSAI